MMQAPVPPDINAITPRVSEPVTKLISVRTLNTKKLVKGLKAIYGQRPGFRASVIENKYIIIQGDIKTVEQIIAIIDLLR
jgi:hypothetical protein